MRPVPSARRPLTALVAVAAVLFLALPAGASARCRGADARVASAGAATARHATLCLLNRIRRAHGLRRLHANHRLRLAATRHSRDMVRRGYFDHTAPNGSTMLGRVRIAGYLRSALSYTVGENIGWGAGRLGTPRAMVRVWMRSPGHRANILNGGFRDVGIGIAAGSPAGPDGATYTTDFGARR